MASISNITFASTSGADVFFTITGANLTMLNLNSFTVQRKNWNNVTPTFSTFTNTTGSYIAVSTSSATLKVTGGLASIFNPANSFDFRFSINGGSTWINTNPTDTYLKGSANNGLPSLVYLSKTSNSITYRFVTPSANGPQSGAFYFSTIIDGVGEGITYNNNGVNTNITSTFVSPNFNVDITFLNLTANKTYQFIITDISTNSRLYSSTLTSPVYLGSPPNAPTNVVAASAVGTQKATISWKESTTTGATVTGYAITSNPAGFSTTVGTATLSTTLSGLVIGKDYTFSVVATSAGGNNSDAGTSNSILIQGLLRGAAPVSANWDGSLHSITYALDASGSLPLTPASYTVTQMNPLIVSGSGIIPTSNISIPSAGQIKISNLLEYTSYRFSISVTNFAGASSTGITRTRDVTAPGSISGTSTVAGNKQLRLIWTDISPDGGSVITNNLYTSDTDGVLPILTGVNTDLVITTLPDGTTPLTNGTLYTYYVRAVDAAGNIGIPVTFQGTPRTTPGAPTITGITGDNQSLSVAFTAPTSTGGAAISNYEYTTNGGTNWKIADVSSSPIVITTTSVSPFPALSSATPYNIQLRAVNAAGSGTATASTTGTTNAAAGGGGEPGAPCFFGNAQVKTPAGYRRMDSLVAGDMVMTPAGVSVAIERIKKYAVAAGPTTNPYVIPAGQFGATNRVLISPDHKVCLADGRKVEAKRLGLVQEERDGMLLYYNLELTGEADMVVSGVAVESLAHMRRVVVTMDQFVAMAAHKYGAAAASPEVLAKLKRTCRRLADGRMEIPVARR
jgi:hypothetical protein